MGKTYSKEELQNRAEKVLEQYPQAKEVYTTPDGQVFLKKDRAELHAGKGKVYTFDRTVEVAEQKSESAPKALTANEAIAAIKAVTELEALEVFSADERKSVKAAYEAKIKELNPEA